MAADFVIRFGKQTAMLIDHNCIARGEQNSWVFGEPIEDNFYLMGQPEIILIAEKHDIASGTQD